MLEQGVDTELMDVMDKAAEFHGHLGPFLVIGVRMGLLAKRTLRSDGFRDLNVIVNTGNKPPLSCVVDGIQVATGCTLGKGNIAVRNLGEISAVFHVKRRTIRVRMKMDVFQSLKEELLGGGPERMEEIARKVSSISDTRLFDIEKVTKKGYMQVKGKV
jgi:formylmethanofuran dehydrogenase subunit E